MLTRAGAQQQELPKEIHQGRAWQPGPLPLPQSGVGQPRGAPGQPQPLHQDLPESVLGLDLPCVLAAGWLHCCRGHSSAVGQRAEHQPLPGDSPGSKASRGAFSGCTIESTSPCESSMIPTSVVHETGRCHCPDPGDGIGVVGCNYLLSRHT